MLPIPDAGFTPASIGDSIKSEGGVAECRISIRDVRPFDRRCDEARTTALLRLGVPFDFPLFRLLFRAIQCSPVTMQAYQNGTGTGKGIHDQSATPFGTGQLTAGTLPSRRSAITTGRFSDAAASSSL